VTRTFPDAMSAEELSAYRAAAKEALRKRYAALRRALSAEARAERAGRASELLVGHEAFLRARCVLAYAALRFELDPAAVIARAHALGKQVALPRVDVESGELRMHAYMPGDELSESGFAVREPQPSAPPVAADEVDLVLVPGLAFDVRGYRLGYGKGFYDRLLPSLTRATRVGLAFELSLLAEVPNGEHDVPVDALVTEKRVLLTERPSA
jgi:5-formyltetrahydrofolate cyclo-ligase